mgnify:FL=1
MLYSIYSYSKYYLLHNLCIVLSPVHGIAYLVFIVPVYISISIYPYLTIYILIKYGFEKKKNLENLKIKIDIGMTNNIYSH